MLAGGWKSHNESVNRSALITKVSDKGLQDKLTLLLPEIEPVQQMEIRYELKGADGAGVSGTLQNTLHVLGETSK